VEGDGKLAVAVAGRGSPSRSSGRRTGKHGGRVERRRCRLGCAMLGDDTHDVVAGDTQGPLDALLGHLAHACRARGRIVPRTPACACLGPRPGQDMTLGAVYGL
jgi:hypothetical protein